MSELKLYLFMMFVDFPFSAGVQLLFKEITSIPATSRIVIAIVLTVIVNVTISRIYIRGGAK